MPQNLQLAFLLILKFIYKICVGIVIYMQVAMELSKWHWIPEARFTNGCEFPSVHT